MEHEETTYGPIPRMVFEPGATWVLPLREKRSAMDVDVESCVRGIESSRIDLTRFGLDRIALARAVWRGDLRILDGPRAEIQTTCLRSERVELFGRSAAERDLGLAEGSARAEEGGGGGVKHKCSWWSRGMRGFGIVVSW